MKPVKLTDGSGIKMITPTHTPADIKVGDRITMNLPIERKWWQIWKPKYRIELREFEVVEA